jgi:hypothetical protein
MLPTDIVNSKKPVTASRGDQSKEFREAVPFKDCWLWFSLWGWWANWFTHAMSVITLHEITAATARVICALATH